MQQTHSPAYYSSSQNAARELPRWSTFATAIALHAAILFVGGSLITEPASVGVSSGGGADGDGGAMTVSLVAASLAPSDQATVSEPAVEPLIEQQPVAAQVVPEPVPLKSEFVKQHPLKVQKPIMHKQITKPVRPEENKREKRAAPREASTPAVSATEPGATTRDPAAAGNVRPNEAGPGTGGGGVSRGMPDYLSNPVPPYPALSRRLKEEGVVVLQVSLSAAGLVEGVTIKKGSGFERLDDAAIKAVQGWRFKPSRVGGIAVADVVEVPIRFALR